MNRHGGADWVTTEHPAHAVHLAANAGLEGYDTVVALGGDGTVHEVINGLMRVGAAQRPSLGVVPVGSGNDFAYGASVPTDSAESIERIFTGKPKAIDVAVARDDHDRIEYWNNTLGIGFDAKVNIMSRTIRGLHGFPMYLVAVFRTLLQDHEPANLTLRFDDGPAIEHSVSMLTLGNGPREGGGFRTTPAARVDDGSLDFMMISHVSRITMLSLIPKLTNGTHGASRHVTLGSFRRLRLRADRALPIHADGELWSAYEANTRELEVEIVPGAIQLLV